MIRLVLPLLLVSLASCRAQEAQSSSAFPLERALAPYCEPPKPALRLCDCYVEMEDRTIYRVSHITVDGRVEVRGRGRSGGLRYESLNGRDRALRIAGPDNLTAYEALREEMEQRRGY